MKSPRSRKAELPPNAMGEGKSHAEAAESAELKMTELGLIPVDWEVKRLGECGLFSKGAGISRAQANSGRIPAVRYGELYTTHHDYIKAFESFISDAVAKKSTRLTCGDIVFACSGETKEEIGKCAAFLGKEIAYAGGDLIIFSPESEYDSKFLAFELNTPICVSQKAAAGQGDAVVHIRRESLENLRVLLPSLAEQRRIAGALSDVDELISALEKLIEKKRNIKTGAMQELLAGKTRLPGFGAKCAKFKQTELGPIPVDWEVKRFDKVFSMLRNNTYARESLTDEREGAFNIHYGDILVKYGALVDFEKDEVPCLKFGIEPNKDMLQDGDLIFADTAEDEMVGKAIEVTGVNGYRAVAGLHTVLCRPNASVFAPGYLGYYINSHAYHNQLIPLITGTKVSSVSRAGFASTYVCIPPLAEQKAIAAVLSDMDAEIAALEADRAKYERIKSGMMQELLTGKTRLKGE